MRGRCRGKEAACETDPIVGKSYGELFQSRSNVSGARTEIPHSMMGWLAWLLRVRRPASGNFALGTADGIAHVANGVNQWRFTKFFPEPTNEHLNQLGVVFVRVLPHTLAQLRACEYAARFPH